VERLAIPSVAGWAGTEQRGGRNSKWGLLEEVMESRRRFFISV